MEEQSLRPSLLNDESRATLRALELAATMGRFGHSLNKVKDEHAILAEAAIKLTGLIDFSCLSFFLVNETTFSFDLVYCSAPEQKENILHEIAILTEDRTFAWALGRNKPTIVGTTALGRLMLHPLSTASGPIGIFAGTLKDDITEHSADIGYYLLTVVLFASATLLENFRLFRDLEQANENLERLVAERTRELTDSNEQLRETLGEKERFRQNLEAVFSSMQDPLVTVDQDRCIIRVNKAGEQFLAAKAIQLIGKPFLDVFRHAEDACRQVFTSAIDYGNAVREFRTQYRHEGIDKALVLSCSPLISPDGSLGGAVLLIRDITRLASLEKQLKERHSFRSIVGKSAKMQKLYTLLETLAEVDTTVLVTGESGTGKELIAEALHHNGARAKGPLIKVNCTALSESLLESELFGHVRGSFTGAVSDKAGRFEAAEGGTIFLDEIGDVSQRIQILLLRFLESKEFERVGDTTTRKADVRIVAATNANLQQKIQQGTFRADLFYRLNVMHVQIPPLRERRDDVPLLVTHFINSCNTSLGTHIQGISDDTMQFFMRHNWPGNIRELKHVIEHGCILARQGLITIDHLAPEILESSLPYPAPAFVQLHSQTSQYALQAPPVFGSSHSHHAANGNQPYDQQPTPQPYPGQQSTPSPHPFTPDYAIPPRKAFHDLSADDINSAIFAAGGNKAHAARMLGIGRATLYRKMHELNISR